MILSPVNAALFERRIVGGLFVRDFDVAPEAKFPGPVVGAVFEGELDVLTGVFGEVDF